VITTTSLASGTVAAAAAGALVADDRLDLAAGIRACFIGMFIAGMLPVSGCGGSSRASSPDCHPLAIRRRPMTRPAWRIVVTGALVYAAWAGSRYRAPPRSLCSSQEFALVAPTRMYGQRFFSR
jgi:hypothetical protein